MLKIYPQKLETTAEGVLLSSEFSIADNKQTLWYLFPKEYQNDLVTERLDAFVVGLLFLALKTGNDIHVNGAMSARLYYTLRKYLIPALCELDSNYKNISLSAERLVYDDINSKGLAATGLSCGIDSLSTFFDNQNEPKGYAVDVFTFFNVGSNGEVGGEKARNLFFKRLKTVSKFAKKVNKEIIAVDSNLSEILQMKYEKTYSLRIVSCVLSLQKVIKTYFYASGTKFDHFGFNKNEIADLDMLFIPNLSTESISFFVSSLKYSRIERTLLVSNYHETYNHLDVCTNPPVDSLNCSTCYKCIRTMLTLEAVGKLDNYKNVFDTSKLEQNKIKYLAAIYGKLKKLTLDKELIEFLNKSGQKKSLKFYFYTVKFYLYANRIKFIKQIKNKLKVGT